MQKYIFLLILGLLVVVIAILMPRSEGPSVPEDHPVRAMPSRTTRELTTPHDAKSGSASPGKRLPSVVVPSNSYLRSQRVVDGTVPQQEITLSAGHKLARNRLQVEATTAEEEQKQLEREQILDRIDHRDPKITERWFELRKQSRQLREGMSREDVIRLLGVPTHDLSGLSLRDRLGNGYPFDLQYSPSQGMKKKRIIDSYYDLGLNVDSAGRLKEWDWFSTSM